MFILYPTTLLNSLICLERFFFFFKFLEILKGIVWFLLLLSLFFKLIFLIFLQFRNFSPILNKSVECWHSWLCSRSERKKKKKNSLSVMFVVDFYVVFFIDALCQVEEVLFLRVIMNGYWIFFSVWIDRIKCCFFFSLLTLVITLIVFQVIPA